MPRKISIENLKIKILKTVFKHFKKNEVSVFLFGSYAIGEALPGSDIDIGILRSDNQPLAAKNYLELEEDLNENIPTLKKIDLVDFCSISDTVKKEALKEIKIWHLGKNYAGLLKNGNLPLKS